jgi:cytochrome c oxidase assembly protein Cox11
VLSGDLETTESLANFQIHKHNNNNGVFIMTQIIIIITRYATALLPILKNTCFFHGLAAAAAKENTNRRERESERERERES